MEPTPVPAPPKSAFNKNRRVSDLLLSQLKHFQHVAHKQGIKLDPALKRDIYTEGGAARYITSITRAMRGGSQQPNTNPVLVARRTTRSPRQQPAGLDMAAEASPPAPASVSVSKGPKNRRSSRKVKASRKS